MNVLSKGNVVFHGLEVGKCESRSENWKKYRLSGAKCISPVLTPNIL